MSRKLLWLCVLAVCLLALAGSLLAARKTPLHRFAPLRIPKSLARTPDRNLPARTAPGRDIFPTARKRAANLARQSPLSLPFAFEPNLGQANSRVAFIGRGRGLTVLLGSREIAVQIAEASRTGTSNRRDNIISMRLTGASSLAWQGREKLRGETNYLIGNRSAPLAHACPAFR